MSTPAYHAPIVGSTFSAGDVGQFLGTHTATLLNQGIAQTGNGTAYVLADVQATNTGAAAQWLAQPFTTIALQTTITRIELGVNLIGTGADTTLELRTDDGGGKPSNTVLWSCLIPADFFVAGPGGAYLSVPCNVSGLTAATKYHVVLDGTASTANYTQWMASATNINNGLRSTNGVAGNWVALGGTGLFTLLFTVFAGTNGVLRNIIEDSPTIGPPVRWVGLDYANSTRVPSTGALPANSVRDGNSVPTVVREVCGSLRSVRTLTYSNGALITIA